MIKLDMQSSYNSSISPYSNLVSATSKQAQGPAKLSDEKL